MGQECRRIVMPGNDDITFDRAGRRFRYRIAGVGIDRGRVILQQIKGTDYWFLPGGRGRIGEAAEETMRREIHEELGEQVDVLRPLWVAENFFRLDGREFHEVSLIFLVAFREGSSVLGGDNITAFDDGGIETLNRWHFIAELNDIILVPSFLKKGLRSLPDTLVHICQRDGES